MRVCFSLYANNLARVCCASGIHLFDVIHARIYITPRVYVGLRDRHGTGISVKSALSTATGPRLSYLAAISADIEIVSRGSWLATRSGVASIALDPDASFTPVGFTGSKKVRESGRIANTRGIGAEGINREIIVISGQFSWTFARRIRVYVIERAES